jgi:fatty-acyl-CoA synthase
MSLAADAGTLGASRLRGTIPDALLAAAREGRGQLVFHLPDGPVELPVGELAERAGIGARQLIERGVKPGDRIGVLGPNRPEWAVWAFATWFAGATVVPVQIPLRVRDRAAFEERVRALATAGDCRLVLTHPDLLFAVPDDLALDWTESASTSRSELPICAPTDAAVIQFTSGSTAAPKGAVIPHSAMLAQVRALAARSRPDPADEVLVGWAPFFHDLGLVLYLLTPPLVRAAGHVLPTELFARAPSEWLRLADRVEASMTVGPQSAWSASVRQVLRDGKPVNLSSVELAWFAAEGIDPSFVDEMLDLCPSVGLSPTALGATYGLAEAVLGVTTTLRGAGVRIDRVDRARMAGERRAVTSTDATAQRIVSCGAPMLDAQVRVVDRGDILGDGQVGEIQVRGPSLMAGYLDQGSAAFDGEWLRTGDLGYLRDGELYVTGRAKDVLIVMGQNYHPEDIEWAANRVPGVRSGRCVAFVDTRSERVVLVIEPGLTAEPASLRLAVRNAVMNAVGIVADEILIVARGTIEKTTSGKLRRAEMRAAYARGTLTFLDESR